jgi:hypothetical protein
LRWCTECTECTHGALGRYNASRWPFFEYMGGNSSM